MQRLNVPFFWDCYSSSCLTSEANFKDQELDWAETLDTYETHDHAFCHSSHISACVYLVQPTEAQWVYCGWEAQAPQLCVIDLVSLKALRLQRTWNWIVACSPTGILITLCQYCSNPPDKPEGLGRQPLIKTSAYCCDSTLFPVFGSDWFSSQVSQWAEPRASASKLWCYSTTQR